MQLPVITGMVLRCLSFWSRGCLLEALGLRKAVQLYTSEDTELSSDHSRCRNMSCCRTAVEIGAELVSADFEANDT